MAKLERVREVVAGRPGPEYWEQKEAAGWRLAAVEWTREGEGEEPRCEEVPFGLQVAADCRRLEENRAEKQVLVLMLDQIRQDRPLSQVAEELNRRGFRTRQGANWGVEALFDLLPRLIEAAPQILSSVEWNDRPQRLPVG